jgi:hypothetical protein
MESPIVTAIQPLLFELSVEAEEARQFEQGIVGFVAELRAPVPCGSQSTIDARTFEIQYKRINNIKHCHVTTKTPSISKAHNTTINPTCIKEIISSGSVESKSKEIQQDVLLGLLHSSVRLQIAIQPLVLRGDALQIVQSDD